MTSLELGLIGNGSVAALVNAVGEIVWTCVPRIDGDPAFCSLLRERSRDDDHGFFAIEIVDLSHAEQEYVENTPLLTTRLHDRHGGCVEITDVAPRFVNLGRMFCPMMLLRRVKRLSGVPRVRVRLRPSLECGRTRRGTTVGTHHVRYVGTEPVLRLTTDAAISDVMEEAAFVVDDEVTMILGPDESVEGATAEVGRQLIDNTIAWWREWVRSLAIPFEWQEAVIRAAITLALNTVEDTGAVVAAVTTSIPEAADGGRTWDYRYCWLRDGYFVVNALNRLGATHAMERYMRYMVDIAAGSADGALRPVYGITAAVSMQERIVDSLPGYRGIGPVRFGNQAHLQTQHDVYGSAILAAAHVFFDRRLVHRGGAPLFERLERLGENAARLFDAPDAGIWEFRSRLEPHTFSAVMCWAASDRLARIARELGLGARARHWAQHATRIHEEICRRAWNAELGSFVATLDGATVDASLLLLGDLGFVAFDDPRFVGTVQAVERILRRGDFVFRYVDEDDFGAPKNAFLVCTFWYINALAAIGRRDEARELFEKVLACRTRLGLLAEHIDPVTREQWGNFVQTYSMVGLINSAIRLSVRWDQAF